jgi:UDP-N-acetylglucosamine 2-epimerase
MENKAKMQKVVLVAGARPNFIKIAPLWRAFSSVKDVEVVLVHTGQHYDNAMSEILFRDLGLPQPLYNLKVGGGNHDHQTANIMTRFDEVLNELLPTDVVVVGDVNSTLACSLVAVKRGIRTSHVEAGLRSFDRTKLKVPEPLGYVDFQRLLKASLLVVTDSGGLQEESTWLGVPCITLRDNTERPVTIEQGTNILVGMDLQKAWEIVDSCLAGNLKTGQIPELWDGKAAGRIAEVIVNSKV